LHDANNPNILRLVDGISTTADDVKEHSMIEVVLSGMKHYYEYWFHKKGEQYTAVCKT